MMKQTILIGIMVVLGVMPLAMVKAADTNSCALPDDIHYYFSGGGFTIWESKKDGLVILGPGLVDLADTCTDPVDGTDNDFEQGVGGANLPVLTVPACRTVTGHHSQNFYVDDLLGEVIGNDFRELVSGNAGADGTPTITLPDGTFVPTPCGDGVIDGNDPTDCLEPFWGKGPHTVCGVGADGSYWVFVDILTVDLNEPRVGASTQGCIWTDNFGSKGIKPCSKTIGCPGDEELNEELQDKGKQSYDKAEGSSEELTISDGIRKYFDVKIKAIQGNQKVEFLDEDGDPIEDSGGNINEGDTETFPIPKDTVTIKITKTGPADGQNFKGERSFVKKCP